MSARRIAASIGWSVGLVALGCANTASGVLGTGMDAAADVVRTDTVEASNPADVSIPRDVPLTTPRLIRPFSNMIATHRRPELRWELPAGVANATVQICRDRACTQVEHEFAVTGTSVRPAADLAPGVHFWNVEMSGDGGVRRSHTWSFRTLQGHREVDTTWEGGADFNGDGLTDVVVFRSDGRRRVEVFYGRRDRTVPREPDTTVLSEQTSGYDLSSQPTGDLDGDGYSDLILGEIFRMSFDIEVYRGGPSGLASRPAWVLHREGQTMIAWGFGGDLNGDGHGDWVFTERRPPINRWLDGAETLVATIRDREWTISSLGASFRNNRSFTYAADLDGDGLHDIVTSPANGNAGREEDRRDPIIGFGPSASRTQVLDLESRFGQPSSESGFALSVTVASRCDFDGDGRSDLLINYLPINLNPQRHAAALWQDGGFRIEELSVRGRNEYLLPQCAMDLNGDGLLESTGEESGPGPGQFGRMIAYQFDPSASRLTELPLRGDVPGRCDELRALGDFDGDGYGDFVCHRPSSDLGRWVTSIFFGSMSLELQEVVILGSDRLAPGVVAVYF